jgi:nucleoside-diphosphate-sugar epimerase
MQFVYVDDLVTGCMKALENPAAVGKAFNIGNPAPVTHEGLVEALAGALGKHAKIVHVPRDVIERNGGNVFVEPLYFGEYFDVHPITGNTERARNVLGVEATPFSSGLAQTYAWHKEHRKPRKLDFAFEDKLIREAGSQA